QLAGLRDLPPNHPGLRAAQAYYGIGLLRQRKFVEAEKALRTAHATRAKYEPDQWTTFGIQSFVGAALLGQKKYQDAEKWLLDGYLGMKARKDSMPMNSRYRLTEALEKIIELYDARHDTNQADTWRKELKQLKGD